MHLCCFLYKFSPSRNQFLDRFFIEACAVRFEISFKDTFGIIKRKKSFFSEYCCIDFSK